MRGRGNGANCTKVGSKLFTSDDLQLFHSFSGDDFHTIWEFPHEVFLATVQEIRFSCFSRIQLQELKVLSDTYSWDTHHYLPPNHLPLSQVFPKWTNPPSPTSRRQHSLAPCRMLHLHSPGLDQSSHCAKITDFILPLKR